jgi:hypothetical protein
MALLFQKTDEVDKRVREEVRRVSRSGGVLLILYLSVTGTIAFVSGDSLASYGKDHLFTIGLVFAVWSCFPFFQEFRIRTKEINCKVSAVEDAVIASRERASEMLEMLRAMDSKLYDVSGKLQGLDVPDDVTYSTGCIRKGLRAIDERLGRTQSTK